MIDSRQLPRLFGLLLGVTLAFRLWLAAVTPITGDEAYFIVWGQRPDWGFYDHPPMVGWWLAALLKVSDVEWWLRLPVILQPGILALGTAWALRRVAPHAAWPAALLVLLAPANVWNVLITTDTPLVYFSFFSALAFLRAARADAPAFYLLAGALLGGAFLSKYFAALLGIAYFASVIIRPTRTKFVGLLLVILAVLPFAAINMWWNWGHCWANLMFNLYNRHEKAGLSWHTPLLYAAMLFYLLTPPVLWLFARRRAALGGLWQDASARALILIALVPLASFAMLSTVKVIGLHWVLSFLPFVFILLARMAGADALRGALRFMLGFAAVHVVVAVLIALLPLETWQRTRYYDGIVMTVRSHELLARLEPYDKDYEFATDGYSPSVTLSYNARRYFFVFGEASSHARHDDILTDFRRLDGRNILVLRKSPAQASDYQPYFREVEYRNLQLHGATFHLVLGRGFDYAAYRDTVLAKVRDRYYAIPAYLPKGPCYFCERYFPERVCSR